MTAVRKMTYRDTIRLDDATTIGQSRTVVDIVTGVGRVMGWDAADGVVRFEMDSEPGEGEWDFAMRVRDLAAELEAYSVHVDPTRNKVVDA